MVTANSKENRPAPGAAGARSLVDESDLVAEILAAEADFARGFPDEQQWDVLANVVRIDGKRVASLLKVASSADTTRENRVPASSRAREAAPRWHTGTCSPMSKATPSRWPPGAPLRE